MHFDLGNTSRTKFADYMETIEKVRTRYNEHPFIIKTFLKLYVLFFNKEIANSIQDFICAKTSLNKKEKKKLFDDVLIWYGTYGFTPGEYFLCRFDEKSKEERLAYYSNVELFSYVDRTLSVQSGLVFTDKYNAYEQLKPLYGREIIRLQTTDDLKKGIDFVNKHNTAILKPTSDYGGNGVKIITNENAELEIASSLPCVLEEKVIQSADLAALNASSVNTVRALTLRKDDRFELLFAGIRVGRKGSIVDNCSSGGIMCLIDTELHQISGICATKTGNENTAINPDTGYNMEGVKIPDWDGLCNVIKEGYKILPDDVIYIGWDLCHTDNGWFVIEINDYAGSSQNLTGARGEIVRSLFAEHLKNEVKTAK